MTDAPHLAWPLRIETAADGSTQFVEVEQDSVAEIVGGVALACDVRVDQLPWAPDLGIPDPVGAVDAETAAQEIEDALATIEPRAQVTVAVVEDESGGRALRLRVTADEFDEEVGTDG